MYVEEVTLDYEEKKTVMASQTLEYNPSIAITEKEKEGSLEAIRHTSYGRRARIGGYNWDRTKTAPKNHVGWLGGYPFYFYWTGTKGLMVIKQFDTLLIIHKLRLYV